MTNPALLPGRRFRLNRGDGGSPEKFTFVCTATTVKLDEKLEFDDAMLNDCDNPAGIATRSSIPKGQMWDITGSGKADHARYATLRALYDAKLPVDWQVVVDLLPTAGGGVYQGPAFIESLSLSKSENSLVTFDFALKGQGGLAWVAAT